MNSIDKIKKSLLQYHQFELISNRNKDMSDNEMIAQFMGMQKNKYNEWEGGWFLPEYVLCNEGHKKQFAVQDLAFDRSWDWLIPVVDNCFDVAEDGDMVEIMHHLQVAVKDEVYREVIQFIDEYNSRSFPLQMLSLKEK